jgi:multimeric flavodoxin WrbA
MKVLAINGSPRGDGESKSELLLSHLVKGMQAAGAEVELVNLRQKKINYCLGCYTCWTKTPGVCIHQDDMTTELFPKWLKAEIAVYSFPLYHYSVNAQMKTFIERTLPVLMPYLKPTGEQTTNPLRHENPATVLLSVAGFPEENVFNALSVWAKAVFKQNLIAELYRPGAENLVHTAIKDEIFKAFEQAGQEIVTLKAVTSETRQKITQSIGNPDQIATTANSNWQVMINEHLTPAEFRRKGGVPRPDSIESFLGILSAGFNPGKAKGKKGILQFHFTGEIAGDCYFTIDEKSCTGHTGKAEKADCLVETPFEVWADIIQGKADGANMFMTDKYSAKGNFALMMVFGN